MERDERGNRLRCAVPSDAGAIGRFVTGEANSESAGRRLLENSDNAFVAESWDAPANRWVKRGVVALYDSDLLNRHVSLAVYFDVVKSGYLGTLRSALEGVAKHLLMDLDIRSVSVSMSAARASTLGAGARRWLLFAGALQLPGDGSETLFYTVDMGRLRDRIRSIDAD